LPDDLTEQLRQVGLIHIVAVSGYNLTIIIYFSQRLLKKRSRFQALVASNTLIVLFLLVTGFSPSIVRAAVVSGIGLVMWYYGRNVKPLMILLLAAVITAGWNPLYIWSSVGWYLSFAAFFGVLVLGPLLHKRFVPARSQITLTTNFNRNYRCPDLHNTNFALYIFYLSVISVVANILVVPLIPFVMLATLIAGIYGMIGPFFLGGVLVLPSRILLGFIVEVTQILSTVPYASIELKITASQTALICGLIIMFTLFLAKSNKQKLTSSESNPIV
jgi:competence protein ComEC